MKILEVYKTLLTEADIQACVKKFGYELFGHELGGEEKNTGFENQYVRDIEDFTDNQYGEETTAEFVNAMETLKGCMKQYPEVLIPEKTKVYRGLTLPAKYFIDNRQLIDIHKPFPYVYKARNKVQSWSGDFDAASIFGTHDIINEVANKIDFSEYKTPEARKQLLQDMVNQDLKMAFVLEYDTNPNEFIFKSKYFRILSKAYHEDELIRIDNNPINVMAKFNDHEMHFLKFKSYQLIKLINQAISEL
jgi:hypothetical protein